jgi:hypothetical protein
MLDLSKLRLSSSVKFSVTIILLVCIGAFLFYNTTTEPDIKVDSGSLIIKGMYSLNQPVKDIKEVSLKDDPPAILNKTNGIGFGNIMRGNFNVSDYGNGKLFLHLDSSPFVYVLYDDTYVIISFKDSNKTKALYDALIQAGAPTAK